MSMPADWHSRRDLVCVHVGADGGNELDAHTEAREVFADIPRHAAGRGVHMTGVGVVHDDRLFGPAVDVYVRRAHAEDIRALIDNVALAENVALLLQIGNMHGDGSLRAMFSLAASSFWEMAGFCWMI